MDHIRQCNAHDLAGFLPFETGGQRVGWVRPAVAETALNAASGFERVNGALRLRPAGDGVQARSAALLEASEAIVAAGLARKMRSEDYGVANVWGTPPLAALNRGLVAAFGVRAYGVHMNGFVRRPDGGFDIWIGVRANDKAVAPGKLDNMVAGGQPIGLGLMENLIKEADEEAKVPQGLARQARPVGCLTYVMETEAGLKPDTQFCYDLELPDDFTPVNADGETQDFIRMPAEEAARLVRETDRFKFNVNLVLIDFFLRHGLLSPDDTPDYAALSLGLRAPLP